MLQDIPNDTKNLKPPLTNTPYLHTCQNSLVGLPQYKSIQYRQEQCQNTIKNASLVKSTLIVNAEGILELSSIEINRHSES